MRLQIEALWDDCFTDNAIRYALENLPKDLDSTYHRCLERVKRNGDTDHVLKVFQWVGCASRSLHIAELQEALAFTMTDRRWESGRIQTAKSLVGRCANLVVLDAADQHVRFAHPSVLQYLVRPADHGHAFQIDYKRGQLYCAEFSINYLSFSDFGLQLHNVGRDYDAVPNSILASTKGLGKMMSKFARCRPRRSESPMSTHLPAVTFIGSTPETTRYKFLFYAAENWANDSKFITRESRMWNRFRSLAIESNASWRLHPWNSDGLSHQSHLHALLAWTVRNRHIPLLELFVHLSSQYKIPELCRTPLVEDGLPALHVASRLGYEDVVTLLLNVVWVNTLDHLRRTPLHQAAEKNNPGVVKSLLAVKGVRVNEKSDIAEETPLFIAIKQGHVEIVKLLLDAGAKVKMKDRNQRTMLSWAAENGRTAVVELLLERSDIDLNAKDLDGRTPFYWAASCGHEDMLKLLLARNNVDINSVTKEGQSALHLAVHMRSETIVQLMLRRTDLLINQTSNNRRETAFFLAVFQGNKAIVKLLLMRNDIDVNCQNSRGLTPLMQAIESGHEEIIELLLNRQDIRVNNQGRSWSNRIDARHFETMIKLLLKSDDIEVNVRCGFGRTSLHWAVQRSNYAMIKLLLQRDEIDVNLADSDGRTALFWAVNLELFEIVKLLLRSRNDFDVNAVDNKGQSPLSRAVQAKNSAIGHPWQRYRHDEVYDLMLSYNNNKTRSTRKV